MPYKVLPVWNLHVPPEILYNYKTKEKRVRQNEGGTMMCCPCMIQRFRRLGRDVRGGQFSGVIQVVCALVHHRLDQGHDIV